MATDPQMFIKIAANVEDLKTAMAQARQAVLDNTEATRKASEAAGGWSSMLDTLGGSFVARVAEGQLLRDAIREILSAVKDTIEAFPDLLEHSVALGNSLYEMAVKTGSSVEGLSELRYVASQTGISFESLGTVLPMMEKALGSTGAAGAKVQDVLSSLGLDLDTLKGQRSDQTFVDIATAISYVSSNADKAYDATVLLGRGAKEMGALFHENIQEMVDRAHELGLVMSTDTAAGAHAAEIEYNQLSLQLEALGMSIATAFIPAIIGVEHDLGEGLTSAVQTLNGALGTLGGGGGLIGTVATAMGTGSAAAVAQAVIYETLKATLIGLVRETLEPLITAIGFVASEFNGAKVIIGDTMQIVDGFGLSLLYVDKALIDIGLHTKDAAEMPEMRAKWQANDDAIQQLLVSMKARGAALQADKQAEADWSAWSVQANHAVEVALNAVGATHTDVAAIIARFAEISKAAYGGAADAAALSAAELKKRAAVEAGQIAETEKLYDQFYKLQNAASHDTVQARINDAWLAADAEIAALEKTTKITIEDYDIIWAKAQQTADNIIQKTLESDKYTKEHYQLLADQAKIAYDFALDHATSYTNKEIQLLADKYRSAEQASMHWAAQASDDMDNVAAHGKTVVLTIQQIADATALSQMGESMASAALNTNLASNIKNVHTLAGEYMTAADARKLFDSGASVTVTAQNLSQVLDSTITGSQFTQAGIISQFGLIGKESAAAALAAKGYGFAEIVAYLEGGALSKVPIGPRIPGYAGGVENAPGGFATVGERGPEIMYVPPGANIYPHGSGVGGGVNVVINLSALTPGDARVAEQLRQTVESVITDALGGRIHLGSA